MPRTEALFPTPLSAPQHHACICSMNPLGVQTSRFVIVEDTGSGATLGFGQLEPKTAAAKAGTGAVLELRSMVVEPGSR